jgi:hypothetical protein
MPYISSPASLVIEARDLCSQQQSSTHSQVFRGIITPENIILICETTSQYQHELNYKNLFCAGQSTVVITLRSFLNKLQKPGVQELLSH